MLKKDFARYNIEDDEDVVEEEDNGWKIIHTDVFRFPPAKTVFCAILGQYITISVSGYLCPASQFILVGHCLTFVSLQATV